MSCPQGHTSKCRRDSSCRLPAGKAMATGACVRVERVMTCEAKDVVAAGECIRVSQRLVRVERVARSDAEDVIAAEHASECRSDGRCCSHHVPLN